MADPNTTANVEAKNANTKDVSRPFLHWGRVRWVAQWRLVTTSYVWLLIVPVAAKLIASLRNMPETKLPWLDDGVQAILAHLELPFSWKLFVAMALAFFVGRVIYWSRCPEIVKDYTSFGDFGRHHTGTRFLCRLGCDAIARANNRYLEMLFAAANARFIAKAEDISVLAAFKMPGRVPSEVRSIVRQRYLASTAGSGPPDQNRLFDFVLLAERSARAGWLYACSALFAGGFFLLLWVVILNLWTVVELQLS